MSEADGMTLAGWITGNRSGPTLAVHTLTDLKRARRSRRFNLRLYFVLWGVFFAYAGFVFLSSGTLAAAIDRYLPLQLVAGIAALAVYLCGRSLRRRSALRRMSVFPAALSTAAIASVALALASIGSGPDAEPVQADREPAVQRAVLVSL